MGSSTSYFRITGNLGWAFLTATTLKKVIGVLSVGDAGSIMMFNTFAASIEEIKIANLKMNFRLDLCANLSLESFQFLIANAANTSAITITVHPDVYAKVTDEDNAEWNQLLKDAASKNISFASA